MQKKEIYKLSLTFLIWRSTLFLIAYFSNFFLKYKPSFPYSENLALFHLPQWLYSSANFDGIHYLTIVDKGYFGTGLIQAFFPAFPLLTKLLNFILNNPLISGLIISNLFSFLLIIVYYSFLKEFFSKKVSYLGVLVLLLFPTSFYLGAYYSESLFMFLVISAFLSAIKKKWWLAGILATFASATRVVGILLVPALLIELYQQSKDKTLNTLDTNKKIKLKNIAWIILGASGLLGYICYLSLTYGDALYFLHVQTEFGGGRSENLVIYPQVVVRYLKILYTARPINLKYFSYVQEFIAGVGGLALMLLGWKKVKPSYLFFGLTVFLMPTMTGTFSSMPRYLLASFPLFLIILDKIKSNKKLQVMYLLLSSLLLIFNLVLFIRGYWVA